MARTETTTTTYTTTFDLKPFLEKFFAEHIKCYEERIAKLETLVQEQGKMIEGLKQMVDSK